MSGIVVIHLGQCGNAVGEKFWTSLCEEHQISASGDFAGGNQKEVEGVKVFFKQVGENKFVPRAVFIDLDESGLECIRSSKISNLFDKSLLFSGNGGTEGNYAKAYYKAGPALIFEAMKAIRREVENCDELQGFLLFHNTGGGTGSGLLGLLLNELHAEYEDPFIGTFSVLPHPSSRVTLTECYNSVFSIADITTANLAFCFDNEALSRVFRASGINQPSLSDMNNLMVDSMSNITAPLRFHPKDGGELMTLPEMASSLVPEKYGSLEKDIIFLTVATSPIQSEGNQYYQAIGSEGVDWDKLFTKGSLKESFGSGTVPVASSSLHAIGILRGKLPAQDLKKEITESDEKHYCLPQLSSRIKFVELEKAPKGTESSITFLLNDPTIANVLGRICSEFDRMARTRAFFHWFTDAGMEEFTIEEARPRVDDVMSAYVSYADSAYNIEDED